MIEKDGIVGLRGRIKRLWYGAKVYWKHPEIFTSKRHASLRIWFIWDGPKYHLQLNFPPCNKAVGGMTNGIRLKRRFFELLECGVLLTLFIAITAIQC